MNHKVAFCPFCEDFHELESAEQEITISYKGKDLSYIQTGFMCDKHPNEFFTNSEVLNENLQRAKKAYQILIAKEVSESAK